MRRHGGSRLAPTFAGTAAIALVAIAAVHCGDDATETEEPKLDPPAFGCSAVDFADASGTTETEKSKVWQIEGTTPFQQNLDDGTQRVTYDVQIPGAFNAHVEVPVGSATPGAKIAITRGELLTPPDSRFKGATVTMGEGSELELGDGPPDTCGADVVFRRITMRNLKSGGYPGIDPIAGELVLTVVH